MSACHGEELFSFEHGCEAIFIAVPEKICIGKKKCNLFVLCPEDDKQAVIIGGFKVCLLPVFPAWRWLSEPRFKIKKKHVVLAWMQVLAWAAWPVV